IFLASNERDLHVPFPVKLAPFVQYAVSSNPNELRNLLSSFIGSALQGLSKAPANTIRRRETAKQTAARRLELSGRVEEIAASIANLRINTLGEYVEQLYEIGRELK